MSTAGAGDAGANTPSREPEASAFGFLGVPFLPVIRDNPSTESPQNCFPSPDSRLLRKHTSIVRIFARSRVSPLTPNSNLTLTPPPKLCPALWKAVAHG